MLAAVDAGADAVDGAHRCDERPDVAAESRLDRRGAALQPARHAASITENLRILSGYWEQVRHCYAAFESDLRSGASEVYVHGMPGGQFTNLREQARSLGIDDTRWPEVARAYAQVNEMFGDIVKVTPTSKVVGDLALLMVTSGLTPEQVLDPQRRIAFPESVVSLFRGDLGQPYGGFPPALQKKVLKGVQPLQARPGEVLPPIDLAQSASGPQSQDAGRETTEDEFASYLMYPKVFLDYMQARQTFGDGRHAADAGVLLRHGAGRRSERRHRARQDADRALRRCQRGQEDGTRTVFFELNGQPRSVKVQDRSHGRAQAAAPQGRSDQCEPCRAPMPGTVATVPVSQGGRVSRGDVLVTIEAMKMETTVRADRDATIAEVVTHPGEPIDSKDLLVVLA